MAEVRFNPRLATPGNGLPPVPVGPSPIQMYQLSELRKNPIPVTQTKNNIRFIRLRKLSKFDTQVLWEKAKTATLAQFKSLVEQYGEETVVSGTDETGGTLLHAIASRSNPDVLIYLLELGCDVNARDQNGWTALHCAIRQNNIRATKIFLQQPTTDCTMANTDNTTAMHYIVRNKVTEELVGEYSALLRLAVDRGCSFFSKNRMGEYPLHFACLNNQRWAVKFAMQRFVNPNVVNSSGDTPLHYAVLSGHLGEVEMLLQHGADRFIVNSRGEIPLDIAKRYHATQRVLAKENCLAIMNALGTNNNQNNREKAAKSTKEKAEQRKNDALVQACRSNDLAQVERIVKKRKTIKADAQGMTPLHYAAIHGHLDIMLVILNCLFERKNSPRGGNPLPSGSSISAQASFATTHAHSFSSTPAINNISRGEGADHGETSSRSASGNLAEYVSPRGPPSDSGSGLRVGMEPSSRIRRQKLEALIAGQNLNGNSVLHLLCRTSPTVEEVNKFITVMERLLQHINPELQNIRFASAVSLLLIFRHSLFCLRF